MWNSRFWKSWVNELITPSGMWHLVILLCSLFWRMVYDIIMGMECSLWTLNKQASNSHTSSLRSCACGEWQRIGGVDLSLDSLSVVSQISSLLFLCQLVILCLVILCQLKIKPYESLLFAIISIVYVHAMVSENAKLKKLQAERRGRTCREQAPRMRPSVNRWT